MITKYIQGDICDTELKYIAHGVNCQNTMGSGVAKALYTKFPQVKDHYHGYCNNIGDSLLLLGDVQEIIVDDKTVYNCFTQLEFGYDGKKYVNYNAIALCFLYLSTHVEMDGPLAIPKIGCGLAGGNWEFMEQLINDSVGDRLEIWVYELE